jgi:hypothetical protein
MNPENHRTDSPVFVDKEAEMMTTGFGSGKDAKENFKIQLAQYLGQQPKSIQSLHRWMMCLEIGGVGIIVAMFIMAMYVSIAWESVNPILIPIAWFIFAASISPEMIFLGLDVIFVRAFPPVPLPGKLPKFLTGSGAVWTGWAFILGALTVAIFWGFFAYAVWTFNMAMVIPMINIFGVVMGIGITVSIVYKLFQDFSRSR